MICRVSVDEDGACRTRKVCTVKNASKPEKRHHVPHQGNHLNQVHINVHHPKQTWVSKLVLKTNPRTHL
jgi:hypothetical protein